MMIMGCETNGVVVLTCFTVGGRRCWGGVLGAVVVGGREDVEG